MALSSRDTLTSPQGFPQCSLDSDSQTGQTPVSAQEKELLVQHGLCKACHLVAVQDIASSKEDKEREQEVLSKKRY